MADIQDSVREKVELEEARANSLQLPVYNSSIPSSSSSNAPSFSILTLLGRLRRGAPISRPATDAPARKLRPTAYLDGIRGFAAFLVYIHHHELWAHEPFTENPIFELPYGHEGKYYMVAFPFLRNFFGGGHYAVSIFFVLSGYVLSIKPLSLIHSGDIGKLGDNLASALFRRWIRLYIPVIATSLIYISTWHMFNLWVPAQHPKASWGQEVISWYKEITNFTYIFKGRGDPWFLYNMHLWSIPTEFVGSICIYITLLAFSHVRTNVRLCGVACLIFLSLYVVDGWYCAAFLAGMMLSDIDMLTRNNALPSFFTRFERHKTKIFYAFFIISMYLGGVPSHSQNWKDLRKYDGWYFLSLLEPHVYLDYKWFYLFFASWMLVASAGRIWWLRAFFETRVNQWLGRISFSLYLVHGPVIWTLGHRIYVAVGLSRFIDEGFTPAWSKKFILPSTGPMGLELNLLLAQVILLPLTLVLAELATRWFDEPSVKIAQWVYQQTLPEKPKSSITNGRPGKP